MQRSGFGGFGPPLLVGGTGDLVLRIAAQHAQIVGVTGTYQVHGQPPGTFRLATQLRRSRQRWGFSYVTVHEPHMRELAPVIKRLRGQ